jgi:mannose-6-phosphate isomerase-like protein (cupin superfamily)
MGKVVNFRSAEAQLLPSGASVVALVDWFDGIEMMASVLRLVPGARHSLKVPSGSDQYLYVVSGEARIEGEAGSAPLDADSWALLEEGQSFTLSGAAELLSVTAPPPGAGGGHRGFRGGLKVLRLKDLPVVDLPEEKKRRIYLANEEIAGSERGHAMVVRYTGETLTRRHHHPNAESLFVILTGRVAFTVDGKERVLGAGEAAFFPVNDSHGLKSADDNELSFLEFHIPGAFAVSYDE